ncbi:S9 family peptidase [Olivibacter sp. SDN3]|uniref:S9 family peptidase n=1 Tax=Olivibacter sp. SDN3 TaxID=2764720 RepID=UPI001650FA5C|nr:S9 family peptidase [Olivibacter sp. SDN3]QNL51533.1 S9 family peptidase [Olivibacter sp. SDN3]
MNKILILATLLAAGAAKAQQPLTPELLWQLGMVSAETVTPDGQSVIYGVTYYDLKENKSERNLFKIPLSGGSAQQLTDNGGGESIVHIDKNNGNIIYLLKGQLWKLESGKTEPVQLSAFDGSLSNVSLSPDGEHILFSQEVSLQKVQSKDKYSDLDKSDAYIFDALNNRHWDTWFDGKFSHVFYASYHDGVIGEPIDIMSDEPHFTPQQPFGGAEDMIWSPDGKQIIYVCKKKFGTEYALSTNTDIYAYDLTSKQTTNLTDGMLGYDVSPSFNNNGKHLAWLSMAEDGYEADKNDIIVRDLHNDATHNLTKDWDETVSSYRWSSYGDKIWFTAPIAGTIQLFEISLGASLENTGKGQIKQLTNGDFDITDINGEHQGKLVLTRTDMNHAAELYILDLRSNKLQQLTTVNDALNASLAKSKVEKRVTKATDGKDLFSWIIYPPDFDPSKKYPTLLYCQGGPQSALSQFYSFRWNMQLIAAQGYIVVAPNRRGMPGHGVEWNKSISGDWGGQPIKDYLSAIDDVATESYVDKDRLGAVGASYGGYSVFMLAGVHENRFKTFIAHDGLFDMRSWYGTTEELFFANKELGGPYWGRNPAEGYNKFNPITYADQWDTPILIVQGGKDFRVGIEQGLGAFQLAQLKGIKSRLLYLPEENHWVLQPQNALVWQREFFTWLKETL